MDREDSKPACHHTWFVQLQNAKADEEPKLSLGTTEPWAKFVDKLNLAYLFAVQDQIPRALDFLSEAEILLTKVPTDLKNGFRLVMKNLKRKIENLPGDEPMPNFPEAKIGVLVVKAFAYDAFRGFLDTVESNIKSALESVNEAYELNPESILLKYFKAYYQFWVHGNSFHVSTPPVDCFHLFFEVLDELQQKEGTLDSTSVKVTVAVAVASIMQSHKEIFPARSVVRSWSTRLLEKAIDDDQGTLSDFLATEVGYYAMYTVNRSKVDGFFQKYSDVHPNEPKLIYLYGRFLYEVQHDAERGEAKMWNAVMINDIRAIKGLVYLAKKLLKPRSEERIRQVEEMFEDFVRRIPEAANDVIFLIHRGGFRYLVMNKKKDAFSDWLRATEVGPERQLITAYTQDWLNTGKNHPIRPADIMKKDLPVLMAKSSGEEKKFYEESLKKVEDFLRFRNELKLESEQKGWSPASSEDNLRRLKDLFFQRARDARASSI